MPKRLLYHFEPKKGWMNDPNGLIYFKGKYHAFFQHNPYDVRGGKMHWGHAVSEDLISWTELPVALIPDQPYEDTGGCFSGSAVEKDGRLYLFYTSVSEKLGQTQSVAYSDDGLHFYKYQDNPVIQTPPLEGSGDFRDPKVGKWEDRYYMVCGTGKDGVGKIVIYWSQDLLHWEYGGVLFQGKEYGSVLECPDFFPLGDKYVLMFSQMGRRTHSTMFVVGSFDGSRFVPETYCTPEAGPHFYAPQTFLDDKGRRILIGWMYSWDKKLDEGADYAGALSIPRKLELKEGALSIYPVEEAQKLLRSESPYVKKDRAWVRVGDAEARLQYEGEVQSVDILEDTKTVEVFINKGEASFTWWFGK